MHPNPLFYIGSHGIYAYGICMAGGIILCFVFLLFAMWKKKFNDEATDKILIIGIFGTSFGIFAAMLFQSLYNYIDNPSQGFKLNGSMTFIGGLIGGVSSFLIIYWLYVYLIAPHTKIKLLKNNMNATLTDALPFIPIGICIAHAFGRLGCFFAGCCYGMPTDSWIGLPCSAPNGFHSTQTVIPTQLFEMVFLLALAAVMAFLYFKFRFNYNFALYLFAYGVWRFFIEFLRDDYRGEFIGSSLTPSQIWSLVMCFAGIGYVFLQRYVFEKCMKHPELKAEGAKADVGGGGESVSAEGKEDAVNAAEVKEIGGNGEENEKSGD